MWYVVVDVDKCRILAAMKACEFDVSVGEVRRNVVWIRQAVVDRDRFDGMDVLNIS